MKKRALTLRKLLALLAVYSPALAGGGQPITISRLPLDPFQMGQTWKLSSTSRLDNKIPASTFFRVSSITADRHITTSPVGLAPDKAPVEIHLLPYRTTLTLLVGDLSPSYRGAHNLRLCFFYDIRASSTSLRGLAAHYDPARIQISSDTFEAEYQKTHPTARPIEVMQAFVRALAPDDNGPCTLELVR
ncbi:hypothetical protein [Deinococcus sp.]|uniref:hypothetical protein n=1 Tax=Deinococcus sp. TaxID=47478 RepID=UPI003CC55C3B